MLITSTSGGFLYLCQLFTGILSNSTEVFSYLSYLPESSVVVDFFDVSDELFCELESDDDESFLSSLDEPEDPEPLFVDEPELASPDDGLFVVDSELSFLFVSLVEPDDVDPFDDEPEFVEDELDDESDFFCVS